MLHLRRPALGLESEAVVGPAVDQPLHVGDDGLDVLDVLLGRIRVVHAQVALAAVFPGDAEVEADRLGVADVQVAVGLRRKSGDDPRIAMLGHMGCNDVADEVGRRRGGGVWFLSSHDGTREFAECRRATQRRNWRGESQGASAV